MEDIWDQSQDLVLEWRWHDIMMVRLLRNKGWTNYAELLRRRWKVPRSHPMAPFTPGALKVPFGEVAEVSTNTISRNEEAGAEFEVRLD
jgi:hypothetical protein